MKRTEFFDKWLSLNDYYNAPVNEDFTVEYVMPLFLEFDVHDLDNAIREYLANNTKAPKAADILFIIKHNQGLVRSEDEMEHDARVVWNQLNDLSWSS